MNGVSLNETKNIFPAHISNHYTNSKVDKSPFKVFERQCPFPFTHNQGEANRRTRSDCSPDGYHIFGLLSFLTASFTTIVNIANNSNLNNNNNNNNNNDNNNNNNNVNVNKMSRKRKRRQGKAATFYSFKHYSVNIYVYPATK